MPLLQTVLDRSREASLCIYFHEVHTEEEEAAAFLRCALDTSPRWKRARIQFSDGDIDIYAQIRGRLSRLEWLELCGDWDGVEWSGPRFDVFEDAPQLRVLALDGGIPVQNIGPSLDPDNQPRHNLCH